MKNLAVIIAMILSVAQNAGAASKQCMNAIQKLQTVSQIAGKDKSILAQLKKKNLPTTDQRTVVTADESLVASHFNRAFKLCN